MRSNITPGQTSDYQGFDLIMDDNLGDVTKAVTPKFALLAPPRHGGTISARYFMPWNCHPKMAVTGAQCLASQVAMVRVVILKRATVSATGGGCSTS